MVVPTPTVNATLPLRAAGFATLVEGLDYAAAGETGVNFYSSRGELEQALPYRELRARALDLAARLAALPLRRLDRVAIVAETGVDFLVAFFACQYASVVPVPLPLAVNFGGHAAYVERLRGMLDSTRAAVALASDDLVAHLREATIGTEVRWVGTHAELRAMAPVAASAVPPDPLRPEEPCYIQYSSGSTSFPRGVLVTQRAITANARAIATDGLELRAGDRCTSWLPLYHDMGLVGCCLCPVLNQISVDYLATSSFARRPMVWLKVLSEGGGTISFGPTFGYELCARRAASTGVEGIDLRRWRVAGIGGEMIRPKALAEFAAEFAAAGFDPRAFVASYGLAEATLAVTFAPLGQGVRDDVVELGYAFERLRRAEPAGVARSRPVRTRAFAICGRPMRGYAVEIRDDHGRTLPERRIGRVCIQGPSLTTGYFRDPEATRHLLLENGWLDTGDMGYLVGGELVVTGRSKDLIILNGRNIWPQDLEWAVERIPGVRAGDVAAFSVTGEDERERVVVIVQCRSMESAQQKALRRGVHAVVSRLAGAECEVVLSPPRSLTFTTSGKLSRAAAKASFLEGRIQDIGGALPLGAGRGASAERPGLALAG